MGHSHGLTSDSLAQFDVNQARWQHYAIAAGVVAATLCLLSVIGRMAISQGVWHAAGRQDLVVMHANPALCLFMLALAAAWHARSGPGPYCRVLCGLSALLAALTASQYITGVDLHLDNALVQHTSVNGLPPGRMAFPTAIAICLLAGALAGLSSPPGHLSRRVSTVLATAALVVPYVGSVVQLYDDRGPHWWWKGLGTSSLTTVTVLLLVGTAVLALQSTGGGYRPRGPTSVAGRFGRALAPMALLLPVLTSWVRLGAQESGLYDPNHVLVWMVGLSTLIFLTALVLSNHWMTRFEQALWQSHVHLESRVKERTAELAQALLRIQETEQRFRALAEASPALIWTSDAAGNINYVNTRLAEYTGMPAEDHHGDSWLSLVHPDERADAMRTFHNAVWARRIYKHEHRVRGRNGTYRWFLDQGAPVYEGSDRFVGYVGSCLDVDDAKSASAALRTSQEQLAAIIEFADVAIISLDEQHRIVLFNAAAERIFGVAAEDMMGQPLDPLLPPDVRQAHAQQVRGFDVSGATARRMGSTAELRGRRANGEEFPVEASISRVDAGGQRLLTAVLRDVSHARALERERAARAAAEEANEAKTRFLSHLSHELRTPLNAVIGFSQLMLHQRAVARDSSVESYAQHILEAGRHLLSMINDLLDLSRIESNKMPLDIRAIPVAEVIQESVKLVQPQAQSAGIHVEWASTQDSTRRVRADRGRLRQILANLLSNAVKYNRPEGMVDVRIHEPDDNTVAIEVQDTGMGMTEQQLAQLFTPFSRLGRENSPIEGTGIGLSLSLRLADLMGGHLEASSVPDCGSTFTVTLEAVQE